MIKSVTKIFLGAIFMLLFVSSATYSQHENEIISNPSKTELDVTLADILQPQTAAQRLTRSFKLSAEMDNYRDNHYFSFTETGSIGRDNSDAIEMSPLDYVNHMSFSTIVEGTKMSINNLPYEFDEIAEFPLAIQAYIAGETGYEYANGNVTVTLDNLNNIPENWKIIINDYRTSQSVDLAEEGSYTFSILDKEVDEENPELTISIVPGDIKQITATVKDGNWDDADTWLSGEVPNDEESLEEVFIEHNILLNKDVVVENIIINNEKTLSLGANKTLTINNGELNADAGNFDATEGTVLFTGNSKAIGNLAFKTVELQGNTHIENSAVVHGSLILNGGFLVADDLESALQSSDDLPSYAESAELIYAQSFEFKENKFDNAFGVSEGKTPPKVTVKSGVEVQFDSPIRAIENILSIENDAQVNGNGALLLKYESTLENEGVLIGDVGIQQKVEGTEGWRFLSSPVSTKQNGDKISYEDLLSGYGKIWTQGTEYGQIESGNPNIFAYKFDDDAQKYDYMAVPSLKETLQAGQGFIAYIFEADEVELNEETQKYEQVSGEFPKYLTVFGESQEQSEIFAPLHAQADTWSLVGNPYNEPISWATLSETSKGLTKAVYIYDHQADGTGYHVYNTQVGSPFGGIIAPFQAFLVINTQVDEERELKFTDAAKTTDEATFFKEAEESSFIKLQAALDDKQDEIYISFNPAGKLGADEYDALKLAPLRFEDYLTFSSVSDDRLLQINNLPSSLSENIDLPLALNSFTADKSENKYIADDAEITIQLAEIKNIPEKWDLYLHNYKTGEKINLREEEEITVQLSQKNKKIKPVDFNTVLTPLNVSPEFAFDVGDLSLEIVVEKNPVSTEIEDTPAVFALEQNYPNPFNPSTTIKYSVPQKSDVKLTVYNVLGMKVAELVNETKSAGNYAVQWDAAQVSSGVYFYTINASGKTLTKRMMLVK